MDAPPTNPPAHPPSPSGDGGSTHGSPRSTHSTPRSMRSTASRHAAASSDAARRIARLEDELACAYASRSTMIRDRARQDDTGRELTANLHDLERHRWAAQGQGLQLIQGLRNQIVQQAAEIQDLDRRLTHGQAHLATASADRDRLDHQLDLATADISDLRSQVSEQERELDEVNHELDLTRGSIDRVQTALRMAETAAATPAAPTPTPPTGPTPDVDRLQAALRQVNEELDRMRTARDTARDQATAAVKDVDQAHQDRDVALRESADLRSCLESAQQVIRAQDAQFIDGQDAYTMLRRVSDRSNEDLENVADALSRVVRWIGLRQCAPTTPVRRSRSRSGSPDSVRHIHKRDRSAPPPRSRSTSRSPARSPSPSFSLPGHDDELPAGGQPAEDQPAKKVPAADQPPSDLNDQEGSDQEELGSPPRSTQEDRSEEEESSPARSAAGEENSESEGPGQETDEEEDESEGSDQEALAALARSRSEARRRQSALPALPSWLTWTDASGIPAWFPTWIAAARFSAWIAGASSSDPWPSILLGQLQITGMILSTLTHHLHLPGGWLFPLVVRGIAQPAAGVGYRDDLITGPNITALMADRPWQALQNPADPLTFDLALHRGAGARLGRIATAYLPFEEQNRQAFWETTHYLPITGAQRWDQIVERYHRDRRARRICLGDRWRRLLVDMLPMMREMWADVDLLLGPFFLQIPVRQRDAVTWYPGVVSRAAIIGNPTQHHAEPTDLRTALIEADTHVPWRNQYRAHPQIHPAQRIPRLRNKFNPNVSAQHQP
ncbi:hypothetical protein PHYSODRAFT_340814 [Phytophthora sojae]|uniref:Uncharacterized protein n=1 Tax=Phytophthora sojae (strain P6497) TaxID=1094619 RepID=G5AAZ3_PHYSP|nr:hypothetical protein PHYSODRAFT_340814 [Phytophthora sojae]EGZ07772.1 hypothetical protein PHYSODRAFT_340814 [Phytophthora sojae]|eukprot:XP_009537338.1 hypothetical protein PHYSODRAFT_340814 [Phytophthora sojae]